MKKIIFLFTIIITSTTLFAQIQNPVKWAYSSKKISAGKYEVHLTANIDNGWHIYSQTTPEGGPVPTAINFTKNPLLTTSGIAKEEGKMESSHDKIFDVDVKQFSNKVDFVQTVTVKANIKTKAAGTIKYMVCNDQQCLPPKTINFSISIQ